MRLARSRGQAAPLMMLMVVVQVGFWFIRWLRGNPALLVAAAALCAILLMATPVVAVAAGRVASARARRERALPTPRRLAIEARFREATRWIELD